MKISGIAFVAYPVTDIARARAFYEGVLKLEITMNHPLDEKGETVWMEYDIGAEHCLAVSNIWAPSGQPGGPTAALEVDDIDAAHQELATAGALDLEKKEIMASPACRFFLAKDPDGNPFMIHQHNPSD